MTTYADIIKAVNGILATVYPKITRYGNDTVDKAIPPYFFVECIPLGNNRQTKMIMNKRCDIRITYVQRVPDQVDNLTVSETICNALGMTLKVNDRVLLVLDYSHTYIEDDGNILQMSFRLDWWEDTQTAPTEDLMEIIHTNYTQEGD